MLPTPAVPPAVAGVVRDVRALAEQASGASSDGPATAEERAAWLAGLRLVVDAAEAAFTAVLADLDAAGDGLVLHAAASTQAWLRGALGLAAGEASERVRIARTSRDELAAAQRRQCHGHLSHDHMRAIARTVRALPPSVRHEAATHLTGLAGQLGVDDLRAAGRHLRHVVDPDGSARHAEEDYGRRWLAIAPLLDGMASIDGVLDAETAATLTTALAPFLVPVGPDDTRTTDQRRADGLADIVTTAVRSGQLPTLSGATTALQVTVPLATLTDGVPEPARLAGTSGIPVWLAQPTVQRLACDASVHRLVLDPDGVPLDLGRAVRTFSPAQRRALAARDGGCRFPGCDRPAHFTDAHHLVPWSRGGTSDLGNGLLLCRHHHRQVHEGGWQISAEIPAAGANGTLRFRGPRGQRLTSSVPAARAGPGP